MLISIKAPSTHTYLLCTKSKQLYLFAVSDELSLVYLIAYFVLDLFLTKLVGQILVQILHNFVSVQQPQVH